MLDLDDLAEPGIKLVIGHENVPVGQYFRLLLQNLSESNGMGEDFGDASARQRGV